MTAAFTLRRSLILGAVLVLALNGFDFWTTHLLVLRYGGHEANPVSQAIIGHGWDYLILAKLAISSVILFMADRLGLNPSRVAYRLNYVVWAVVVLYAGIALWNGSELFR